jgi:peroxiredoxin
MTIAVGDRVPAGKFKIATSEGPGDLTTAQLFDGKRVLFFAVPGAFTPTCDARHLPATWSWPIRSAPGASTPSPAWR